MHLGEHSWTGMNQKCFLFEDFLFISDDTAALYHHYLLPVFYWTYCASCRKCKNVSEPERGSCSVLISTPDGSHDIIRQKEKLLTSCPFCSLCQSEETSSPTEDITRLKDKCYVSQLHSQGFTMALCEIS